MNGRRRPSEDLLVGRRGLDAVPGCELLEDFAWESDEVAWRLRVRLTADVVDNDYCVPATTEWVVLIDAAYPAGRLDVFPAVERSIVHTFGHQSPNIAISGRSWRSGKLCLDLGVHALGRREFDDEPMAPAQRLEWHIRRAREWLAAASRDALIQPGERYELPSYLASDPGLFAFSEDVKAFEHWSARSERWGIATVRRYRDRPDLFVVSRFASRKQRPLLDVRWGNELSDAPEAPQALWIRLSAAPVIAPYAAPITWGELLPILVNNGIDAKAILQALPEAFRDGKSHLALLGFPIAERVGEPARQMFWQALRLPSLARGKTTAPGFRPGAQGWPLHDLSNALGRDAPVSWLRSENWGPEEISARGRLAASLRRTHALLLGAGAVGSVLAELLIRGGLQRLSVIDDERVAGGNLVRHTLGLADVAIEKAVALAARLNRTSPHARVDAIITAFPRVSGTEAITLRSADLILDCTGSDEVLERIGGYGWGRARIFASVSLGLHAGRLFVLLARGESFPRDEAMRLLHPWLAHERDALREIDLPRDGLGCWHPLHPARVDDVWRMAATAVREIEQYVEAARDDVVLLVYEAAVDGMRRTERPPCRSEN